MMDKSNVFELVLIGGARVNRFIAFVPKGEQGRAAEHDFEWRGDSAALAIDLGDLARAASTGELPENDLHLRFGRQLYDTVFAGAVGELWQALRLSRRNMPTSVAGCSQVPFTARACSLVV